MFHDVPSLSVLSFSPSSLAPVSADSGQDLVYTLIFQYLHGKTIRAYSTQFSFSPLINSRTQQQNCYILFSFFFFDLTRKKPEAAQNAPHSVRLPVSYCPYGYMPPHAPQETISCIIRLIGV